MRFTLPRLWGRERKLRVSLFTTRENLYLVTRP